MSKGNTISENTFIIETNKAISQPTKEGRARGQSWTERTGSARL